MQIGMPPFYYKVMKKLYLYLVVSAVVFIIILTGCFLDWSSCKYWIYFKSGAVCFTFLTSLISTSIYRKTKKKSDLLGIIAVFSIAVGTLVACLC